MFLRSEFCFGSCLLSGEGVLSPTIDFVFVSVMRLQLLINLCYTFVASCMGVNFWGCNVFVLFVAALSMALKRFDRFSLHFDLLCIGFCVG